MFYLLTFRSFDEVNGLLQSPPRQHREGVSSQLNLCIGLPQYTITCKCTHTYMHTRPYTPPYIPSVSWPCRRCSIRPAEESGNKNIKLVINKHSKYSFAGGYRYIHTYIHTRCLPTQQRRNLRDILWRQCRPDCVGCTATESNRGTELRRYSRSSTSTY